MWPHSFVKLITIENIIIIINNQLHTEKKDWEEDTEQAGVDSSSHTNWADIIVEKRKEYNKITRLNIQYCIIIIAI